MAMPAPRPKPVAVPPAFARLVRGFRDEKGVVLAPGFGPSHAVLKVRGKVFAIFMPDRMVVKLPRERVDAMCETRGFTRFDPRRNGQLMKEWLVVPASDRRRNGLAREAMEFVGARRGS